MIMESRIVSIALALMAPVSAPAAPAKSGLAVVHRLSDAKIDEVSRQSAAAKPAKTPKSRVDQSWRAEQWWGVTALGCT
jgi:hypothetical protein